MKSREKNDGNKLLKCILVVIGVLLLSAITFCCYATYELQKYNEKVAEINNTTVMLVANNGMEFGETSYANYKELKSLTPRVCFYGETDDAVIKYYDYIINYLPQKEESAVDGDMIELITYSGENLGKISKKCMYALNNGLLEYYTPLNKEEKETLYKYREYIKPHLLKEVYFKMPKYKWICRLAPRF